MTGPEHRQPSSAVYRSLAIVLCVLVGLFLLVFLFLYVLLPRAIATQLGYPERPVPKPTEYVWHAPPLWTPDGRQIIFSIGGRIYAAESDGSKLRLLHGGDGGDDLNYAPQLSPDGTRVMYYRYRHDGFLRDPRHWEIAISALDGSDERTLTDLKAQNDQEGYSPVEASWSDDGRRVTFKWREEWIMEDYSVGIDGAGLTKLESDPVTIPWGRPASWGRSSDGRKRASVEYSLTKSIAYATRLFTSNWDGTDRRELFWLPLGFRQHELYWVPSGVGYSTIPGDPPQWSPDDSLILAGPFVVAADGSHLTVLPRPDGPEPIRPDMTERWSYFGGGGTEPWRPVEDFRALLGYSLTSWSPDGSRIAILTDYNSVLYTVARDGTDSRVLVQQDDEGNLSAAGGRPLREGQTALTVLPYAQSR